MFLISSTKKSDSAPGMEQMEQKHLISWAELARGVEVFSSLR